eukprot:34843-Eustigmatos_ZCMA.PRE.1
MHISSCALSPHVVVLVRSCRAVATEALIESLLTRAETTTRQREVYRHPGQICNEIPKAEKAVWCRRWITGWQHTA